MTSKMNSCFFPLLLLQLCGVSVALVRDYELNTQPKSWSDAQSICREKYTDLATITSDEEQNKLQSLLSSKKNQQVTKWIGLKRNETNTNTWQWSDGETPTSFKWSSPHGTDDCVALTSDGWCTEKCSNKYDFFCYTGVILVKENKTWEEALEYCRTHYRTLVTLDSYRRLQLSEEEASPAQTARVWTGLRFVDGRWWWVSGDMFSNSFPPDICPAPRYRCGAHNFNSHVWENRDCTEKLNFLCS